jgi:Tfp pilus assembly protein PilF
MATTTHPRFTERTRPRGEKRRATKILIDTTRAQRPRWLVPAICLLLIGLTFVAYRSTLSYPFTNFDDGEYVFDNPHVTSGLVSSTFRWAFTSTSAGNWHPLTWLSHALDWQLFGANAGGHHGSNLVLHALNACLLFLWLNYLTGRHARSFAVSLLFTIHPLNVESVAWIAERKNLLCTAFFLSALWAYAWYRNRPGAKRYALVILLFASALAAKPMAVTFPLVLLVLDCWSLGRVDLDYGSGPPQPEIRRSLIEKMPLFALSAAASVVAVIAQRNSGAIVNATGWPLSWRIENSIYSYAMYLLRTIAPLHLAPFYPATELHWWQVAWAASFLVAIIAIVWRFKGGRPSLVFGSLWFAITLIPVIGFVQIGAQARADRYMYIPMIGLFVAAVWTIADVSVTRTASRWKLAALSATAVIFLIMTRLQVGYWQSSLDLWTHTLAVTRNNAVAEENLAVALLDQGRDAEAFPHFQRVLLLRPEDPVALLNTGNYFEKQGQHREAIERFQKVRDTNPDAEKLIGAYRGLGVAFAQLGDRAQARANFLEALRRNPAGSTEMYNLSLLELRDSIDILQQTISRKPTAEAYLQLGQLLQEDEQSDAARMAYEHALRLNPRLADARAAIIKISSSRN